MTDVKKNNPPKKSSTKSKELPEKTKKPKIDWEAIEREYCLGQKTTRVIGYQFNVSHVAIIRKAKKEGWVQDKRREIKVKTEAGLAGYQKGVTKKVTTLTRDQIEIAAQTNIQVVTSHRTDIGGAQSVVRLLMAQAETAAKTRTKLEETAKVEAGDNAKRRNALIKAVSLPSHAAVVRDLSTAMKNLIGLERQAYSLDKGDDDDDDPIENINVTLISAEANIGS